MAAVEAAVTATGHDTISVGSTATPTIGLLVKRHQAAGGIQISASHNPPQYNGLKFFQPGGMVLNQGQGTALLNRWTSRDFAWSDWKSLGRVQVLSDPDRDHLERVLEIVDVDAIRCARFRVVLDACHGAGGRLGGALLDALGCQTLVLGGTPDGRYDHLPEPTETNLAAFSATVLKQHAAIGFAQDPDADRLAVVDETGRYIGEELTLALATYRRLQQASGPVVLNLSTSRVTEELARRQGCRVFRTAVGEINVVERMIAENALIGGEGNGGVIDPRIGHVRDSFVAMALILDLMATSGEPISHTVSNLPHLAMVKDQYPLPGSSLDGRPVQPVANRIAMLWDRLEAECSTAQADRTDGLRLDWPGQWVHIRASNTEPIVRVIAEAEFPSAARELADRIGRWVTEDTQ